MKKKNHTHRIGKCAKRKKLASEEEGASEVLPDLLKNHSNQLCVKLL